jgi:hydrogenase maturation protease
MRALVLGVGNTLLSDEGVGVRVVERLAADWELPEGVAAVDGGTAGMALLDDLAGADHLIVVDCARLDAAPGTVRVFEGEAAPAFFQQRISPHQIGLCDLLAGAALIGALPKGLTLIAVEPQSMALGLELTPTGEAAASAALALALERLAALGLAARPRALAA